MALADFDSPVSNRNQRLEPLIRDAESKSMMAFGACRTVADAAACWAALSSTVGQSARLRIAELGGNADDVALRLDEFFLEHPEC